MAKEPDWLLQYATPDEAEPEWLSQYATPDDEGDDWAERAAAQAAEPRSVGRGLADAGIGLAQSTLRLGEQAGWLADETVGRTPVGLAAKKASEAVGLSGSSGRLFGDAANLLEEKKSANIRGRTEKAKAARDTESARRDVDYLKTVTPEQRQAVEKARKGDWKDAAKVYAQNPRLFAGALDEQRKQAIDTVADFFQDPALGAQFLAEQIPNFLPPIVAANRYTAAARAAGVLSKEATLKGAEKVALLTGAIQEAGGAGVEAEAHFAGMSDDDLRKLPDTAELEKRGLSLDEIRERYGKRAGRTAAPLAAVASLGAGKLTGSGKVEAILGGAGEGPAKSVAHALGRGAKRTAIETVGEGFEEGLMPIAGNIGKATVDPTQPLLEGSGEGVGMGAFMGTGLGGGGAVYRGFREGVQGQQSGDSSAFPPDFRRDGDTVILPGQRFENESQARAEWAMATPEERADWMTPDDDATLTGEPDATPADPVTTIWANTRGPKGKPLATPELAALIQAHATGVTPQAAVDAIDAVPDAELQATSKAYANLRKTLPEDRVKMRLKKDAQELADTLYGPAALQAAGELDPLGQREAELSWLIQATQVPAVKKALESERETIRKQRSKQAEADEYRRLAGLAQSDEQRRTLLERADKVAPKQEPNVPGMVVGEATTEAADEIGAVEEQSEPAAEPPTRRGIVTGAARPSELSLQERAEYERTLAERAATTAGVPGGSGTVEGDQPVRGVADPAGNAPTPGSDVRADAGALASSGGAAAPVLRAEPEQLAPLTEDAAPKRGKQPLADTRLQDEATRSDLNALAQGAGWSVRGGELIRTLDDPGRQLAAEESGGAQASRTVTGRTSWIPNEPWFASVQRDARLTGNETGTATKEAVRKALAGEPMSAAEKRHVSAMMDHLQGEARDAQQSNLDPQAGDDLRAVGLAADEDNTLDYSILQRADEIDPEGFERAAVKYENDDQAFLAWAQETINGNKDTGAAAGRRGETGEGSPQATEAREPGKREEPRRQARGEAQEAVGKPLARIKVDRDAVDPATGTTIKIRERADLALKDVDKQIDQMRALIACMKG